MPQLTITRDPDDDGSYILHSDPSDRVLWWSKEEEYAAWYMFMLGDMAHKDIVRVGWDEAAQEQIHVGGRVKWKTVWQADRRNTYADEGHHDVPHRFVPVATPPRYPPDCLAEEGAVGFMEDLVGTIAPHSEADPMALIIQFLAAFGNLVGRRAYFQAERDRHYPNLFAVLVGETSKGRKGTSWSQAMRVFRDLCPPADEWLSNHISSGLSSGEGLIHVLRDTDPDCEETHSTGQASAHAKAASTIGAMSVLQRDKRLLVRESEFASVLKMFLREGNTLSAVLRQAWDGDTLSVITKHSSERASNAHISVVGHITRDELVRNLNQTEAANGLGNRFLWLCVRRSKLLPVGGELDEAQLAPLRRWLRWVIGWVETLHDAPLVRDEDATGMWFDAYPSLSEGESGLAGALTARAEAQVMRIASIYALLHRTLEIDARCMEAALSLWEYAEHSVRYIFGDTLGDATADTILRTLREAPGGLTRTELSHLFGRNLPAAQLDRALSSLAQRQLVLMQQEKTGGRPSQRWYAISRRDPPR